MLPVRYSTMRNRLKKTADVEKINRSAAVFVMGYNKAAVANSWTLSGDSEANHHVHDGPLQGPVAAPTSPLSSPDSHARSNHEHQFKYISASSAEYNNSILPASIPTVEKHGRRHYRGHYPKLLLRAICRSLPSPCRRDIPHIGGGSFSTRPTRQKPEPGNTRWPYEYHVSSSSSSLSSSPSSSLHHSWYRPTTSVEESDSSQWTNKSVRWCGKVNDVVGRCDRVMLTDIIIALTQHVQADVIVGRPGVLAAAR